jgi:serine protease Do
MRPIANFRKPALLTAALAAVLICAGFASAQGDLTRNSPKVVKLFRPVVAKTSESTVRVICDGRDTALGAVVGPDGWIVTKAADLTGTIVCKLKDGKEYSAKIVGIHPGTDLAVLKIEATGLKTIEWRDSKEAGVGRFVASAAPSEDPVAIGVVSVGTRPLKGDQPPRILAFENGWLGVGLDDAADGATINQVAPKSPAEKAGLKVNDTVTHINDKKIVGAKSMINLIQKHKPHVAITLKVNRGDEVMDIKVKLDRRPAEYANGPQQRQEQQERSGSALSIRRGGFPFILQHDTIIKPTDCGGPLVDLDGKVVGINIARAGRTESYAIPSEEVQKLLLPLMSGELAPPTEVTEVNTPPPEKK